MFTTNYSQILEKLDTIDPINYGATRNYLDGGVTYLSPYISRGVLSTKQVLMHLVNKGYELHTIEGLAKELAWRDYFQRVGQVKNLTIPIKNVPIYKSRVGIPTNILNANVKITAIDKSLTELYSNGYLHNHSRMYVASLVCNIAQCEWLLPARWMYYHLLDGDWASNACSWQWVAGLNSNKKYFANQENISKYTKSAIQDSFLNTSYEDLMAMGVPDDLKEIDVVSFHTDLPNPNPIVIDPKLPSLIYNYYNMDPKWHENKMANRILLLEPEHFNQYPISAKCMQFLLGLCSNIPQIKIFVGSFNDLILKYGLTNVYYKEHPFNSHYIGTKEERPWLNDQITGYYPSFFSYWKHIVKYLSEEYRVNFN